MNKTYVQLLKCDLTDTEVADAARDLARANAQKTSIETAKKEVDSQLKADIAAQDSIIGRLSALINTGHEYRNIDCRVELDTPEPGKKTVVRLDTGEIVNVKPMTDADRQMVMDLQTAAESAEEEARAKEEADKVIVTPAPELKALGDGTSVLSILRPDGTYAPIAEITDIESQPEGASVAPAATMGGTHQKKRKGKEAAAGDQQ